MSMRVSLDQWRQFVLGIDAGIFVKAKLPLEGTAGHAAAPLRHDDRLLTVLFKGHCPPSRPKRRAEDGVGICKELRPQS
jgi:hypothetical protein